MDEDRNLVEKGIFQGQAVCSEITESHGGFFKTGTPAFCSESIGIHCVSGKIETEKTYLSKNARQV